MGKIYSKKKFAMKNMIVLNEGFSIIFFLFFLNFNNFKFIFLNFVFLCFDDIYAFVMLFSSCTQFASD